MKALLWIGAVAAVLALSHHLADALRACVEIAFGVALLFGVLAVAASGGRAAATTAASAADRPAAVEPASQSSATSPVTGPPAARPPQIYAERLVIGPECATLQDRIDPYTRTRFAMGEEVIRCGGACGRVYKRSTAEALEHVCPVDGASLRPRAAPFRVRITLPRS